MGWLGDFIGDIAEDLYSGLPKDVKSLYEDPLPELSSPDISFRPFGVTTGTGSVRTSEDGSVALNLSPQQQAIQDSLFGKALSMFDSPAVSEQDVYERIRAMQRPEEERQRSTLENRLFSQGRLGVTTNQFGGTPEGLAMEKAIAESKNAASLAALEQARAERAANASVGGNLLQLGYAPQSSLLTALGAGTNVASLADVARRQQGEFDLETQMANLRGLLDQKAGGANLFGQLYGSVLGGVGNIASTVGGGLFDKLMEQL